MLALYTRNELTRDGFVNAAASAGLRVVQLTAQVVSVLALDPADTVFRAPGGLLATAIFRGAPIRLAGPTPQWFASLDPEITGRSWRLLGPAEARSMLATGPVLVKLSDGKHSGFPARLFAGPGALDAALAAIDAGPDLSLLATRRWLSIESEYRVFTASRTVLTCSPYLVEDEPWSPLLRTHRASFHAEAAAFVEELLADLPAGQVPPAAAMDVARLGDGRLVLLEANSAFGAGLYGCDPHAALVAVLAANAADAPGPDDTWLWRPDPDLRYDSAGAAPPPPHRPPRRSGNSRFLSQRSQSRNDPERRRS